MERMTLGRMQNPIRGFLHGGAAIASIGATAHLILRTLGSATAIIGSLIYGLALLTMYTVSSLYHSIPWSHEWKKRLQRVDHSMIYLVVAGTWTPLAIAGLDNRAAWISLGLVWSIALVGIAFKLTLPTEATWLSMTLQLVMGWVVVFWIADIWRELGAGAVVLIGLGGLFYTVGAIVFATKRPRLAVRSFSYHELFHVFVVLASTAHFLAIALYAVPRLV